MLLTIALGVPVFGAHTNAGASTSARVLQEYLVIDEVTAYNASVRFAAGIKEMGTPSTSAHVDADAAPFLSAALTLRSEFKSQQWPSSAASEIRQVNAVSTSLIVDLRHAGQMAAPLSLQSWTTKTGLIFARWIHDMNLVNVTLGEPTIVHASHVNACNADVAMTLVAIGAFRVQNPGVEPTRSLLLGNTDEGPFMKAWPDGSPYFTISLNGSGEILVAAPSSYTPVRYRPNVCNSAS
jgi:hypothetical protein